MQTSASYDGAIGRMLYVEASYKLLRTALEV
jgi:hypothetical protein